MNSAPENSRFERIRIERRLPTRLGLAFFLGPWFVIHSPATTRYVSPSGSHTTPFTNWPSAATNIQAAIDVAVDGDTVLVTNGVYDTGGVALLEIYGTPNRIAIGTTNRIVITNAVTVRSVNGPDFTYIVGSGPPGNSAVRCTYVGDNARLEGFTLTNGHTRFLRGSRTESSGGGALCETAAVVSECKIVGNAAERSGGGGTDGTTVQNCIVYYNVATGGEVNCRRGTVEYTCTTPDPGGAGNITNEPQFVDASVSNFHLLSSSPCIDTGSNQAWMVGAVDLDGNPRIFNGLVDMGAYEFVSAADAVQRLIWFVNESGLRHKRPMLATLEAALASIERDSSVAAINQLHAFQNKVLAQVFPIDPDLAMELIEAAAEAIEALESDGRGDWDTLAGSDLTVLFDMFQLTPVVRPR